LSIYFNCGRDDEFGFENSIGNFQAEAIEHEYHLYPGNHDAGYFLAHLGEARCFTRVFSQRESSSAGFSEGTPAYKLNPSRTHRV